MPSTWRRPRAVGSALTAERVRAYGAVSPGNRGISVGTPSALHVLVARIESEMRGWAHVEHTLSTRFVATEGAQAINFPELRIVASVATPHPVGVSAATTRFWMSSPP